jgi:endo-1,4-beta-mannosidase
MKPFRLGVNYWARHAGPRMWERWDEAKVAAELRQMRAVGLDCIRCFAFIPSMMPHPPSLDPTAMQRWRRFGELAREAGVALFPTALVGHMSGENFDFPGGTRALFTDEKMLYWQRALVTALAEGDPAGWVLSNEMPLWAEAAPPDAVYAWCQKLIEAIRGKSHHLTAIGIGDGNMGGWPTKKLAPLVDWLGPHVYYGDADPMRQGLQTDLSLRQLQPLGKPLLLEEFGCSSNQAGEAEQAAFWREAVVASLAVGASGALGWCWSDFALGDDAPYSHHPFELSFGITRADGSEKPVCDELRAMRRFLDEVDVSRWSRPPAQAALVVPAYLEEAIPFSWEDRNLLRRTLLQSYVLACQAGLDPAVVSEDDDLGSYRLILCPSTQKLKSSTWSKLEAAARAGATVYWSYFSGDYHFHQGMWCSNFSSLTGLVHHLRFGCFDLPGERFQLRGAVALDVPTSLGKLVEPYPLARLPIEAKGARVLGTDGDGRPALTAHDLGEGEVIFLAWPLERYLALLTDGSQRDAHRLYRLLGEAAGVQPRYPTRHPDVHSRVLHDGADDLVIVQHRGWAASVDDATEVPGEAEILFDRGNDNRGDHFGPKGVRIYRVPGTRTA